MAAADIEGVGEQFVRRLWDLGLLRSIPDLYRLTKEQLAELDGYADISAQNAVDSIAASKQIPFSRVLFGLNIPDVGWVTAQNLARHFGSVDALLAATAGGHRGGGRHRPRPRRVDRRPGSPTSSNRALVEELRDLGLRLELGEAEKPVEGPLTGSDVRHHRHAGALVARAGARGAGGEGRQGDGLGLEEDDRRDRRRESRARRLDKARKAGVEILDEAGLERLVG